MTGFGLASAGGVPLGLHLGITYGWQFPFIALAALGAPILLIAAATLPRMRGHLKTRATDEHAFRTMFESFAHPNHLRAFALVVSLMFAGFVVFPFISQYLVRNIGVPQDKLFWSFIAGGGATLFVMPAIGWLADRYGKLRMFRIVAPLSAVITLAITCYSSASVFAALALVALVMVTNSARMVPAMAMITSSVEPHRRGGFLSANSCVQHLALGIAASIGGLIVTADEGGPVQNYPIVGGLSAASTLISLWLAGRLRVIGPEKELTTTQALAAGAEGMYDADEPVM
jgi:MFS transporter, DHA1 family, inner membrane transport protein